MPRVPCPSLAGKRAGISLFGFATLKHWNDGKDIKLYMMREHYSDNHSRPTVTVRLVRLIIFSFTISNKIVLIEHVSIYKRCEGVDWK